MKTYKVNVRAIVHCETRSQDAPIEIPHWEIYDVSTEDAGQGFTRAVVRCDQGVRVEAEDEKQAVEEAKDAASVIGVDGWDIGSVKLWVDDNIDVEAVPAAAP